MSLKLKSDEAGFTLVELLVAMAILGIIIPAIGAALISISVACWLSRENGRSVVAAMLLYNVIVAGLLLHAAGRGRPLNWELRGYHPSAA